MNTFGKKMAALRKDRKISQGDLAKILSTSVSVIVGMKGMRRSLTLRLPKKLRGFQIPLSATSRR